MTNEKECDGSGQLPGYQLAEGNLNPCSGCPKCQPEPPPGDIGEALEGLETEADWFYLQGQFPLNRLNPDDKPWADQARARFRKHLSTVREWVGGTEQLTGDLRKICDEKDWALNKNHEEIVSRDAEIARLREEVERWKEEADEQESSADEMATENDTLRGALGEAREILLHVGRQTHVAAEDCVQCANQTLDKIDATLSGDNQEPEPEPCKVCNGSGKTCEPRSSTCSGATIGPCSTCDGTGKEGGGE